MRICLFTSRYPEPNDSKDSLPAIELLQNKNAVEEICVTGYRRPGPMAHGTNIQWLDGERYRFGLCRQLFKLVDDHVAVPSWLALAALPFCASQILEVLVGCDPDIVLIEDVRWHAHLRRVIRQRYPQWTCLTNNDQTFDMFRPWRTFDPSRKVSVILPTYNGSKYLRQSIESCLNQTYKNLELIVVDDGSGSEIGNIVGAYRDPRVKYLRHERNRGLAEALNTGFKNSTGEYLTWTSDDNYYAENAIEEMVRFLQTYPELGFVYTSQHIIDERPGGKSPKILKPRSVEWLEVNNGIGACFLYKREVYETIGNYNPAASLAEDYDYWVRVSKQFKMQRLFKPLYHYRRHKGSLTEKCGPEQVAAQAMLVKKINHIA